ncbi:helix-turn-helix transcriptional regulator [Propionivibrio limicola]|uniref:helix-turn-helix transcriptional regulator n=1 Tax=Propionivibrio limicola TaxID=167645 RepID=UPI001290D3D9|nr:AraC family transcriptional regulator [Propionivibrio limicola]
MLSANQSEPIYVPSLLYRDEEGQPALELPPQWRGIPLNLYRSLISAERGPCHLDWPVLIYCHNITGQRWYRENGKTVELGATPGQLELLDRDYQREWGRWETSPGFTVVLQLTPETLTRLAPELTGFDLRTTHVLFDPKVEWLVRELLDEAQRGAPEGGLYAESLSCALIARLAKDYADGGKDDAPAGGLSTRCRCRIVDFIEANLGEELSVTLLAQEAGLSPNHFANCFTASFGQSPHRYVLRRRIQEALRLLPLSSRSIAEIAMDLGFSSQSHFTKVFREYTGMTPSGARRS